MDSGIYQITFPNGYFYLGKSETISQRWKTHQKNFVQGTHTKKMQAAYDEFGEPEYKVLLKVHAEHIGIFESVFINNAWGPAILNTTKPKLIDSETADQYLDAYDTITLDNTSCMLYSTLQHVTTLREQHNIIKELKTELKTLKLTGVVLPDDALAAMDELKDVVLKQNTELRRLAKLSAFDRMFNYKVYV